MSLVVSVSETHFTNPAVRNSADDMQKQRMKQCWGPEHTSFQRMNNKYEVDGDGGFNVR
jgi:hypothetical protein